MHCPFCRHHDSRVTDSRETEDGAAIRRRRACSSCGRRFTTLETASLSVVKRSGATEPFSRAKVVAGVRKACSGRPVTEDELALLGQRVEEAVRQSGSARVAAHEIGLAILEPLRGLDEVAYMRFASVYRSYTSLADFEAEIAALRSPSPSRQADARTDPEARGDGPDVSGGGPRRHAAVTGVSRTGAAASRPSAGIAKAPTRAGRSPSPGRSRPGRSRDPAPPPVQLTPTVP